MLLLVVRVLFWGLVRMCVGPKRSYFVGIRVVNCILWLILNFVYMYFSTVMLYDYDDWLYFPEDWM